VLPDRGYDVEGTTDYRARLNKVSVRFRPAAAVGSATAEGDAITLKVEDTILLTDAAGDINDNAQLAKFGPHNGMPNERNNLSEKWEGMGLVPALDLANPRDFFLLVVNDNDFITQTGFQVGAPYKAEGGVDVDTMMLAYRATLPKL
jgi:hypothetical protein